MVILPGAPPPPVTAVAQVDSVPPAAPTSDRLLQTDVIPPESSPSAPSLAAETVATAEADGAEAIETVETDPPLADARTAKYEDSVEASGETPLMGYSETFPHVEGAEGGCFGMAECRRVSNGDRYRQVAEAIVDDLAAQGYQVDLRDDLDDTGRNVYELIAPDRQDEVTFLIVFSDIDGSAVYVMSDEIMTLNDLRSLQVQATRSQSS